MRWRGRAWVVVMGVVVGLAGLGAPAEGRLLRIFDDPNPDGGDGFASVAQSVLLLDTHVVVSAPLAVAGGDAGAGVVYVFDAGGRLLRTLQSPNPAVAGGFGAAIAAVGPDLLVAAPGDAADGTAGVGEVYRFELTGFTMVQHYRPPQLQTGIAFGTTLLVDGSTLYVAGANSIFSVTTGAGVVHAVDLVSGSTLRSFEPPADVQDGGFGRAMLVSGGDLVVGAPGTSAGGLARAGTVSFFDPGVTGAPPIRTIQSTNPTTDGAYGAALAGTDAGLLIGAPGNADLGGPPSGLLYVIDPATGVTRRSIGQIGLTAGAAFGASVVVDGGSVSVAAPGATDGGHAHAGQIFQLDPTSFAVQRIVSSPSSATDGGFGTTIAVLGTQLLVGEPKASGTSPTMALFDSAPAGGGGGGHGGTTTTSTTTTLPGDCTVDAGFTSAQCQLDALSATVTADALGSLGNRLLARLTHVNTQVQNAQAATTPKRSRRALRAALSALRGVRRRLATAGAHVPFPQSSILDLLATGAENSLLQVLATS